MRERSSNLLILVSVWLLASACMNIGVQGGPKVVGNSGDFLSDFPSFSGPSTLCDEDYDCPEDPNVSPNYDYWYDGSGYYTVSTHQDYSKILVNGQTAFGDEVCIYPVEYISSTQIFVKDDPGGAGIWKQCYPTTENGIEAQFTGTNFNYVFIVENVNGFVDQMDQCIAADDSYFCPPHSLGRFRLN